jgi:hypothetical protein
VIVKQITIAGNKVCVLIFAPWSHWKSCERAIPFVCRDNVQNQLKSDARTSNDSNKNRRQEKSAPGKVGKNQWAGAQGKYFCNHIFKVCFRLIHKDRNKKSNTGCNRMNVDL